MLRWCYLEVAFVRFGISGYRAIGGVSAGSNIIVSKSGSEIGPNLHSQRRTGTMRILMAAELRTGPPNIIYIVVHRELDSDGEFKSY